MFEDSFIRADKNIWTRAWAMPAALIVHALIVGTLIVIPLMSTSNLPVIEITSAFLAPPPPPSPPPPPPPKKAATTTARRIKPVQTQATFEAGKLVAPVEIPDEIAAEQISDIGVEGGVEGGIEGGVIGGVLGGVVGGILGGVVGEIEAPVRAIGEVRAPKLLHQVDPVYPEIAIQARVQGIVIIEATTDIYGRVQNVKVIRTIPLLDQAALDAVRQWVYEPMIVNGRPRGIIFTVTVTFTLK